MIKQSISILRRNFCQPVVITIIVLAFGLWRANEARDALFILVVILLNVAISVFQEIKAALMLQKLELHNIIQAHIIRDGTKKDIAFTDLQINDTLILTAGEEIPADASLIKSDNLEVNEAILTGESIAIRKNSGDKLLAGSIIVGGAGLARVEAVGDNTQQGKMQAKLKTYKPKLTPLQKKINRIITVLTYVALGFIILIYLSYVARHQPIGVILKAITSGAITLIPEGLLLASSLLFSYGALWLSNSHVLPQKISAIEGMALIDVLATDKTGTLTSPEISWHQLTIINQNYKTKQLETILANIVGNTGNNITAQAISKYVGKPDNTITITANVAFSSERKMSTLAFTGPNAGAYVLGAPEYVAKLILANTVAYDNLLTQVTTLSQQGLRVLVLAKLAEIKDIKDELDLQKALESGDNVIPLALITLKNDLRPNVPETIAYMQKQGISVRIISGDSPETVKFIAKQAGINHPDAVITGAELAMLTPVEFIKAVNQATIFARILPEQKQAIISALQKSGSYTAMVGDGVNDALAIKQSDLGIAMNDGSSATRRLADLVLLNNAFTALPAGMQIGNKILAAIQLIARIFFHKIIFTGTLLITSLLMLHNFPWLPRHITFINFIAVTLPVMLITLTTPKINDRNAHQHFWRNIGLISLPLGILSGGALILIYIIGLANLSSNSEQVIQLSGLSSILIVGAGILAIVHVWLNRYLTHGLSQPLVLWGNIFYSLVSLGFIGLVFGIKKIRLFFDLVIPQNSLIISGSLIILSIIWIQIMYTYWLKQRLILYK